MSYSQTRSDQELQPQRPKRRHHWWRWIVGGIVVIIVLVIGGAVLSINAQPAKPALALPAGAVAAPTGTLAGTYNATTGSEAGFRLKESFLGASDDVIGRTTNVTGTAAVAGSQLSTATFQINLDSIVVSGKTSQPQLVQSLNTAKYPAATITLTQPVTLPAEFISGTTIDQTVPATLSLNGTTKPVTVTLTARRDGSKIEAAGSLPVAFSDFSIQGPKGYGFFGSLSTNGSAEFVLVLAPATAG
ncbi:MAG TPA: YceI family protein [Pseudonocardiaceae bacterium]